MTWITDPMLAAELAASSMLILFCKAGVWLVYPVVQVAMMRRR